MSRAAPLPFQSRDQYMDGLRAEVSAVYAELSASALFKLISAQGSRLEFAPMSAKDNRFFVLAAIKQDPSALQHASLRYQNSPFLMSVAAGNISMRKVEQGWMADVYWDAVFKDEGRTDLVFQFSEEPQEAEEDAPEVSRPR